MNIYEILVGNKFADCNKAELEMLWENLKDYYQHGYFASDTLLSSYKELYCEESPIGIVRVEQDLLRAIACKFCD